MTLAVSHLRTSLAACCREDISRLLLQNIHSRRETLDELLVIVDQGIHLTEHPQP